MQNIIKKFEDIRVMIEQMVVLGDEKTNLNEVISKIQKWIEINYESPEKFFRIN